MATAPRAPTKPSATKNTRPYKWSIIGFLISILVAAVAALVPPLLFRTIVDQAIPEADKRRIVWLTIILVTAAILDAVLQIIQRWYSARIGEGLIYDLRVALFDKVQNMPIAFFTRTQTGALISRLNNDVVGAIKKGDEVVGAETRVKVVKNKVAPPFRQAEFDVLYGEGISREGEIIEIGAQLNFVEKAGSWYSYNGEKIGQGKDNAREFLKENPKIAQEIEDKIRANSSTLSEAMTAPQETDETE